MSGSNRRIRWRSIVAVGGLLLLVGCGSSAGSVNPSSPAAQAPAPSTAEPTDGASPASEPGACTDTGPIGGDIGDRTKGSAQAQITGGLTASVDLPFGAAAAQLLTQGPGTAYLPFTDPTNGTLFLTISGNQLLVQYAGPNDVGLTNGATPCDLKLDALDDSHAKGTFTCKGMLLIQGNAMGNADMSGSFDAHR